MPLTYSNPTNFPSPLVPVPSNTQNEPREGRMQIPVEILWASMGGTSKTIAFNLQENAPSDLSQIASLIIDNSACTVPVTIIFPDTSEKIVIPANAKRVAIGVYTNGLLMIVSAATAIATDETRIQILNYRIPPVYIP